MIRTHACAPCFAFVLCLAHAVPAAAQWTVEAGLLAPRFSGGAVEPATGRSLRPYRPTMWEVGIGHRGSRAGVGLRLHYASSSLALEGSDGLAAVKDALTVYGAEPEITVRLTQLGPEGVLRLYAGPLFEVWKLPDAGSHFRVGVWASVGLDIPFGGRWASVARLGGAVTPASPFTLADLDGSLEPRALWRREVSASVRYRL